MFLIEINLVITEYVSFRIVMRDTSLLSLAIYFFLYDEFYNFHNK